MGGWAGFSSPLSLARLSRLLPSALTAALVGKAAYPQIGAETTAGLTPTDYTIASPDKTGIAHSARYFTANERGNVTECSAKLLAIAGMCQSNGWGFRCAAPDRFKTTSTVTFTLPCVPQMAGARIVPDTANWSSGTAAIVLAAGNGAIISGLDVIEVAAQGPNGGETVTQPPAEATASYDTLDGISIQAGYEMSFCTIKPWSEGFRDGIVLDFDKVYIVRLIDVHNGKHWRYGWNVSVVTAGSGGENISVEGGSTFNCVNAGADGASQGTAVGLYANTGQFGEFKFKDHSFDYNDYQLQLANGKWEFDGCHGENNNDNPAATVGWTAGVPTMFSWKGGYLGGGGGTTGYSTAETATGRPVMIETTATKVEITVEDYELMSYGRTTTALVKASSGVPQKVRISGMLNPEGNGQQMVMFSGHNVLQNAQPASTAFMGWTPGGGASTTQTIVATGAFGGTYAFQQVNSAAVTSDITQDYPCDPDDQFIVQGQVLITAFTAGSAGIEAKFLDQNGDTLSTDDFNLLTAAGGPTWCGGVVRAPIGARTLRVNLAALAFQGTVQHANISAERVG